mmetsp:Transcript_128791/g.400713  ORF Transcript_128791/g.400713 Transcript_128791/m.400713 type:complete len:438 (+) Transcript_128791:2341-3654(+)
MVQEDAVHGIPDGVQAAEGEGEVAEAPAEGDAGALALDLRHSVDEVNGIGVVLREPCGDGQHVAVEDDVLSREVQLGPQKLVGPLADAHLVRVGGELVGGVDRHHHHGGAIPPASLSHVKELLLPLCQGDGIHNALPLDAPQALLDNGPLHGAQDEGCSSDLRVPGTDAHELANGRLRVRQLGVEVEVQDVRACLALGRAEVPRRLPLAALLGVLVRIDEAPELLGAPHVAALADDVEAIALPHGVGLQARELQGRGPGRGRQRPRGGRRHLAGQRANLGRRHAAGADEVDELVRGELRGHLGALTRPGAGVAPGEARAAQSPCRRLEAARGPADPHGQRPRVPDADEEGFGALSGGHLAAVPDDRGDHQRRALLPRLLEVAVEREDRGLRVQGVGDHLDGQQVRTAVHQTADLRGIDRDELVPRGTPRRGVLGTWG